MSNLDVSLTLKLIKDQFGANAQAADRSGRTPLMYAAMAGDAEVIAALLSAKAAVNAQDSDGLTALMWAALRVKPQAVKALVDAGADVSLKSKRGLTAGEYSFHPDIVKLLPSKPKAPAK